MNTGEMIHRKPRCERRRGAMMVMIAFLLVILFVAAAFAIDIAYMHATRAELRTATDAAARAAAEALGRLQSSDAAIDAALRLAEANTVAGDALLLDRSDVVLGSHRVGADGRFRFIEGGTPVNSIRVTGERTDGSRSGAVPLFFGPLFGVTRFQPVQQATSCRLDRDIALVLDVSGSMNSFGRFTSLKNALRIFLQELQAMPQECQVSLSVYSTDARQLHEMTTDFAAIDRIFSTQTASGFTAIGLGLRTGLRSIKQDPNSRPFAFKEILLMTDGNHNTGINPLAVVPEAQRDNVTVHAITFSRDANQALMRQVAQQTGGVFLHANTNQELIDAFREIAVQVPVILID
jgi:Ca-activated chloride channel homolog